MSKLMCVAMGSVVAAGGIFGQATIDWFTIDSGGGELMSSDGSIVLIGSIGQPDASEALVSGDGSISLTGGFLAIATLPASVDCPGDANGDGIVSLADFSAVLSNFGLNPATRPQGDVTGDGVVSLADFSQVLSNFGLDCN